MDVLGDPRMHCTDDGYTQCAAGPRDTGCARTVTLTRTQAWITAALSALMIDAEAAAEEVEDAVLCCLCRMYRKPRRPAAAETKTAAPLEDIARGSKSSCAPGPGHGILLLQPCSSDSSAVV